MEQIKRKLLMAGFSLTIAMVLMVSASLAWMTISTKPEISGMQVTLYTDQTLLSSGDINGNYVQYLDISEKFKNAEPLRPTSTVDGENWFIPTYHEVVNPKDDDQTDDGSLKDPSEFLLATEEVALANGYYVYADFWLKTEETACDVRLSVPDALQLGENENFVGSYVLAGREQMPVNGNPAGFMSARESESCVRVGFRFTDPTTGEEKFLIYEPNADQRSSDKKPTDTYVHGYQFDKSNYEEGSYIKTQPIGLANGVGEVQSISPERLIIQKNSVWGEGAAEDFKAQTSPTSSDVHIFGEFISSSDIYKSSEIVTAKNSLPQGKTTSDVLLRLKQDEPVQIRMFIWLEGQDVDCWNDIAAGSFIVNLELAGETIE